MDGRRDGREHWRRAGTEGQRPTTHAVFRECIDIRWACVLGVVEDEPRLRVQGQAKQGNCVLKARQERWRSVGQKALVHGGTQVLKEEMIRCVL